MAKPDWRSAESPPLLPPIRRPTSLHQSILQSESDRCSDIHSESPEEDLSAEAPLARDAHDESDPLRENDGDNDEVSKEGITTLEGLQSASILPQHLTPGAVSWSEKVWLWELLACGLSIACLVASLLVDPFVQLVFSFPSKSVVDLGASSAFFTTDTYNPDGLAAFDGSSQNGRYAYESDCTGCDY